MEKKYKFIAYDPFKTYDSNLVQTFVNTKGQTIPLDNAPRELFGIGRRAFELLELGSNEELDDLIAGYFYVIEILSPIAKNLYSEGKVRFVGDLSGQDVLPTRLIELDADSNTDDLIEAAPSLLKLAQDVSVTIYKMEDAGDVIDAIENDVKLACLAHTLIEIDLALCAHGYRSPDVAISISIASQTLSLAESIIRNEEMKKNSRIGKAKFAAKKRHSTTDRAKEKIREIWATGKYSSRDICAEQECANLNISFSTARKALRNTPDN